MASGRYPFRVSVHSLRDGRVKAVPCASLDSAVKVCNRNLMYTSASVVNIERLNTVTGRFETIVTSDTALDSDRIMALYRPVKGRSLVQVVFDA